MANSSFLVYLISEVNFAVMVRYGTTSKPLIVPYGICFHGDVSLQAEMERLFNFHGNPTLRVSWAYDADLGNPWPVTTPVDEDTIGSELRFIAARRSQDIIEAIKPAVNEPVTTGIIDEMEESLRRGFPSLADF